MNLAIVAIFSLTYVLIAARQLRILPIGRPSGALLGAVLMVAVGALTPEESYRAIDHDTIVLLFGMMVVTVYLERCGFFDWAARFLLGACRTPGALLAGVAVASGSLSALLVNDTVCVFLTPIIVAACSRASLPLGPYLIALATSANIGSAATLVGNPQNMIIGSLSGFPFLEFAARAGPAAALGLAINVALLRIYYGKRLGSTFTAASGPVECYRPGLIKVAVVLTGILVAFSCGLHLGYSALGGALALIVSNREDARKTLLQVDWPLLVFFCGLFVVVAGLEKTGWVRDLWQWAAPHMDLSRAGGLAAFTSVTTFGSNLVSNVPMVLLTGPYLDELGSQRLGWVLLAFTTTVAGNLTLVGSVANIIVAESARDHYSLGFLEYLAFGAVSTLAVLAAGVPFIVLWMGWLG